MKMTGQSLAAPTCHINCRDFAAYTDGFTARRMRDCERLCGCSTAEGTDGKPAAADRAVADVRPAPRPGHSCR